MEKDELFIKRLSFIKYLFDRAVETSGLDQPLCNAAILGLQDGVELFLDLALEYNDLSRHEYLKSTNQKKNDISFMEYWDVFESKIISISGKDSMRKLNEARVELKHRGLFADKTSIGVFVKSTTTFFVDNCKSLFEIDFDSFSMLFLVKESEWKELLKEAEVLITQEKWVEANEKIALAFHFIKDNYHHFCTNKFRLVPGVFAQNHGLDVASYNIFLEYSPSIQIYGCGGSIIYEYLYNQPNTTLANAKQPIELATPERVKICFDYVVETAIALQNKYDTFLE